MGGGEGDEVVNRVLEFLFFPVNKGWYSTTWKANIAKAMKVWYTDGEKKYDYG